MKFDAVIVLAGGIQENGALPMTVKQRIDLAYQLFRMNVADKFVFSGKWSVYWDHFPPSRTEAQLMKNYAVKLGFNSESIFVEEHSQNTFENAFYAIKLFIEPNKWKKVLVITSDFHLQRCKKIFNYLGSSTEHFYFLGAKTDVNLFKKTKWTIKENFLSNTQWLFQYFLDR